MIKVENIDVFNFEGAIRGMRNPLNSWDKSDSGWINEFTDDGDYSVMARRFFKVGRADLDLMRRLCKAGTENRKFLRQIFVSMDITAPLYWISECDTYKVGTTRNSCSFMHKGLSKPFELTDFSTQMECYGDEIEEYWENTISQLNKMRQKWLETKDDVIFETIRCMLPSGYNQRFTLTMTYENVFNIINQRQNHRLSEWRELCEILKDLPYVREIGGIEDEIKSDS